MKDGEGGSSEAGSHCGSGECKSKVSVEGENATGDESMQIVEQSADTHLAPRISYSSRALSTREIYSLCCVSKTTVHCSGRSKALLITGRGQYRIISR